jgi:hypothetical protein
MNEASIHLLLRYTARTTFAFFTFAFTGNALRDLWPTGLTLWLARKRDWFLIAVAVSHTLHLAAIIALFQTIGWAKLQATTLVGGGLVYLLIYMLALNAVARLLAGQEKFLLGRAKSEAVALYLIWLVFALAFVPRIVSGWPLYSLLGALALTALALRIACLVRHRRARAAAA